MSMVCPQCSTLHEQRLQCPHCGGRLVFRDARGAASRAAALRWQQTPWGRILIGLVLAQGLFYGLRHLLTGVLLAFTGIGSPQELWGTVEGLLWLQGAQFLSLLLGGVLAGGGQRHGLWLGAIVGIWNGVLAVLLRQNPTQGLTVVALCGQPLLHAAFGAIGGGLGCFIWKPLPLAPVPGMPGTERKPRPRFRPPAFTGPVSWFRVLAGVSLAVAGTLSATVIFDKVLALGAGKFAHTTETQDWLITWEIKALALIVGGALAGATTSNGLKHGLLVGLFASMILITVENRFTPRWAELALLTLASSLTLCVIGGWFGSQLFPPVVKPQRNRLGPASLS
jgi:hypothetical protein